MCVRRGPGAHILPQNARTETSLHSYIVTSFTCVHTDVNKVTHQDGHKDTQVDICQQAYPKACPRVTHRPRDQCTLGHAGMDTHTVMHSHRYTCSDINKYGYPLIHKHRYRREFISIYQHGHVDTCRHAQTPHACTQNDTHMQMYK